MVNSSLKRLSKKMTDLHIAVMAAAAREVET